MVGWILSPSSFLALSLVACLGYLLGRFQQRRFKVANTSGKRAIGRAQNVCAELDQIGVEIQLHLSQHRTQLLRFRRRVTRMANQPETTVWDDLAHEAECLLKPTLRLSTQVSQAYDSIRQQANLLMAFTEVRTDPLTGLQNRRALNEALQSRLAMLQRYRSPFAVVVFDIDHFKRINDEFGHVEGDQILQEVGRLLDESARDTDLVTRFGGEEFVIVMPQTELDGACRFAERTRKKIEERLTVTVSCGVAEGMSGEDARGLLTRADEALYAAKEGGRNRVYSTAGGLPELVAPAAFAMDVESGEHCVS